LHEKRPGSDAVVSSAPSPARLTLGALILLLMQSSAAHAQAWLPEAGSFNFNSAYSDNLNKKHYLPDGEEFDAGQTRTQTIALNATYALTDDWLLEVGVPFVSARYSGTRPHPTEVDDGTYHGSVTDVHLALHFQALVEPFALAPYTALVIPLEDYETLGHAAPGRGLQEFWLGFYAGKSLDEWLSGVYIVGRYNYAFVERVAGIAHDRSNLDLELGWFFTPQWSVRALFSAIETHGGIPVPVPTTHPLFEHHDQLAAERLRNVGAGVSWSMSDRTDVYLLYLHSVWGESAHKLDQGVTFGFSYSLSAY
jgi:hypothetical protein